MNLYWLQKNEIDDVWPVIRPIFQGVIDKAVKGEFTVDDVYDMAMDGSAFLGVARENGDIVMALAFEFRHYPQKMGVNVFAMGGRRLTDFMENFLEPFKVFCKNAGADWIECSVSAGMEKLHHKSGFKTVYRNLRMDLGEEKKC